MKKILFRALAAVILVAGMIAVGSTQKVEAQTCYDAWSYCYFQGGQFYDRGSSCNQETATWLVIYQCCFLDPYGPGEVCTQEYTCELPYYCS